MDFRYKSFAILFLALFAFGTTATAQADPEDEDEGENGDLVSCPEPEYGPNAPLVLLPHPESCSKFFYCVHGKPEEDDCPGA